MKFYGHATSVAQQILAQFRAGSLPKALAPIFLHRGENVPCRKWSWNNQLLVALAGFDDARGVRQWNAVERFVRKGEKAFYILAPCIVQSKTETDDQGYPKSRLIGFKSVPVFGYGQTDGKPLPARQQSEQFLDSLPLREVAQAWGLSLSTANDRDDALGWYSPGLQMIGLGVENLATYAHELCHAADDRLGTLTERGQHWQSETVAELGGATLLYAMGYTRDADLGGAWDYISWYSQKAGIDPINACLSVLSRVCEAVDFILRTAEELRALASQGKAA